MTRATALMLLVVVAGCGDRELPPTGQILLFIDTDAPVLPPPGTLPGADEPVPLFDRLRVRVFRNGESAPCPGCSRELEVNEQLFRERAVSFGVVPEPGVELLASVELFRAVAATSEGPLPGGALEATLRLPVVEPEGIERAAVTLWVDDLGKPRGSLDAPIDAEGAPRASRVGSWPGARRVPCGGPPGEGEVCIPGGAFWMGNPAVRGVATATDADRLRLVVLSPFFLDQREVTVRDARASGDFVGVPWSGGETGAKSTDWCTFTFAEGPKDDLPVTCLDWSAASGYCEKRGARLPSEAEHEYVAGALESRLFPWGNAEPDCDDAIWGQGGAGILKFHPNRCLPEGEIGSPAPPGTGARDRVAVGGSWVLDLAGNVTEWKRDRWNSQDEPCWAAPGVYRDPVCELPSATFPDRRPTRGGAFAFDGVFMASAARGRELEGEMSGLVGFRCARSALP